MANLLLPTTLPHINHSVPYMQPPPGPVAFQRHSSQETPSAIHFQHPIPSQPQPHTRFPEPPFRQ
ncbi:hypothetical protein PAXRUDRAFT_381204 [Paxillus rubicundulus Ve08.2h10]|uniref:Unplaced genomic scaffold scaffold_22, whole genome shotgun sequence n=1 Tax=Paxillus rubicundulus Ve08.2h10 TaxID=930991 RepID=A0A0D0DMM8_9AGAM|nr:hypothetical protein PAXRUDRAFT_381204 [Paxillus rubicundulus Ve08.2h10]